MPELKLAQHTSVPVTYISLPCFVFLLRVYHHLILKICGVIKKIQCTWKVCIIVQEGKFFLYQFVTKVYWILSNVFFHLLKFSYGFCPSFCCYVVLHLSMCVCQIILAFLGWVLLVIVSDFGYTAEFSLPVLCTGLLRIFASGLPGIWVYKLLFYFYLD